MKRVAVLAFLALAIAPFLGATPADAAAGDVVAAVTGGVNLNGGSGCGTWNGGDTSMHLLTGLPGVGAGASRNVAFTNAVIAGTFDDGPTTYAGTVNADNIPATVNVATLGGEDSVVLNQGRLCAGGSGFEGTSATGCLSGDAIGGSFTTLGVVALVSLPVSYDADANPVACATSGHPATLLGVIEVVPAETAVCEADTTLCSLAQNPPLGDTIADVVVGQLIAIS